MRNNNAGFVVLGVILLCGLALRLLFAFLVPTEQMFDFATYLELGRNISRGLGHTIDGAPVAWQGPLYAYVLGGFFWIMRTDSEMAAKALNIILSTLTIIVSIPVYARLLPDRRRLFAAVALTAFLPVNIAYVNVLGTEVLFVFLLMSALCLFLHTDGKKAHVVLGILTGLLALTRPFMLAFPAALCLLYWLRHKKGRQTLIFTAIVTVSAMLIIAPWAIRNMRHFDRFIPISYNAGYVRFINNNDHNDRGLWMDLLAAAEGLPERDAIAAALDRAQGDVKRAHDLEPILSAAATRWKLENPGAFLQLGFMRVYRSFFAAADDLPQWAFNEARFDTPRSQNTAEAALNIILAAFSAVSFILAISLLPAFFAGVKKGRETHFPDMLFCVLFVFFVAVIFISEGQPRYAFPVYPLMIYALLRKNS